MKMPIESLTGKALYWAAVSVWGWHRLGTLISAPPAMQAAAAETWFNGFGFIRLITEEHISLHAPYPDATQDRDWGAGYDELKVPGQGICTAGPDPVTAGLRCFLKVRFYETFDIPDELLEKS